jgi:hypothetical protein
MGFNAKSVGAPLLCSKDSQFVIDDYAPTPLDYREMELKRAWGLLRAQGNRAGRGRLKSDMTERPAYYPRGIIISTSEQHPPGQSVRHARC